MTLSLTSPFPLPAGKPDHLYEAWEALRLARQVPWSAHEPGSWHLEFHEQISRAQRLISAHVDEVDGAEATLVRRGAVSALRQQLEDHAVLLNQIRKVLGEVEVAGPGDVHAVVDLSERTALIEMRVAMHQNRLLKFFGQSAAESPPNRDARARVLAGRI